MRASATGILRLQVGPIRKDGQVAGPGRGGRGLSPWWMKAAIGGLHLSALLAGCTTAASADAYRVLSIGDGDTITLTGPTGNVKVRLACIDAPESSQRPAGPAARAELQQLLPVGTAVQLRIKDIDRYGRTVAEVFKGNTNVNQALVGSGMAFVYWDYTAGCDRNRYAVLEASARAQHLGVWGDRQLLPPWDYRSCKRAKSC